MNDDGWLKLFWLNLQVKKRGAIEFCRVVKRYYHNKAFRSADLRLRAAYFLNNAFSICKRYLTEQGAADVYTYGETPLTTLDAIVKECGITAQDHLFDLGCATGRTSFWLNALIGCQVSGIEIIPHFIFEAEQAKTKEVKEALCWKNLNFRCEDILKTSYSGATAIYLYGTCFDDAFLEKLIKQFKTLPKGAKVITVSYPLTDLESGAEIFLLEKQFTAPYTWGTANVYLQVKQ